MIENNNELQEIIEKLSPIERKIVPYLDFSIREITKKSGLDSTTVLRALDFLQNKNLLKISERKRKMIDLGVNGIYYKKNHLPERKLLTLLESGKSLELEEAKKLSKLSDNEFKVSLGVLKRKTLINLNSGKISLNANKSELSKKTLEEQFLDALPLDLESLTDEQKYALENLKLRKNIVEVKEEKTISFHFNYVLSKF